MPLLEALLAPLPRSPQAETLITLLATLSPFFKNLLGSDISMLEQTWELLVPTLVRCNPEISRAVSEVWATVLRRSKAEFRKTAVSLILRDVESLSDSVAWMLVYAFKVRQCLSSQVYP